MNLSRREFLMVVPLALVPFGSGRQSAHPEPRRGITAADVLKPAQVPSEHQSTYAGVAANPYIFDGIRCPCGCHRDDRSLFTCYTTTEPMDCGMCGRAADAAIAALENGGGLDEARAAVDRRFGPPRASR